MNLTDKRILVTGGNGFLGKYVVKQLLSNHNVPLENILVPRKHDCDLREQIKVIELFKRFRPHLVIHLAASVGGIEANRKNPGNFIYDNIMMGINVINAAHIRNKKTKVVHIGSVCSYPKFCPIPFKEDYLWSGYPEETNAPYGIAKKTIGTMLQGYYEQYDLKSAYLVPVNLYGPGDHYNPNTSHVIPALIFKCIKAIQAKENNITVWGTGEASREFLYVEDAAEGILKAAQIVTNPCPINLGTGREIKIKDLVTLIVRFTGFKGTVNWETSKPDGQPRRCLDVSRAKKMLSWEASTDLEFGLKKTVDAFKKSFIF